MLNINPDTVRQLIERAQEFHTKDSVASPDGVEIEGDWGAQILAEHESDPTLEEFRLAVEDLEPDQQVELVALMWVGRGDFSSDEWDAACTEAGDQWNARTADYLIGTPLVATYLADGLEQLGYRED